MKKLYVEVADTPIKREYGLMDRKSLGKNEGMLFKFPYYSNLSFWMKNTYFPLDIAFIDDDGKVLQISEMFPLSTKSVSSKYKCKYALEVNKGWFKENGVDVGSYIGNLNVKNIRTAQMTPQVLPEAPAEDNVEQPPEEQTPNNVQEQVPKEEPAPSATLDMSIRNKIDYANAHNLPMTIVYTTLEGHTLPPRKVVPVPHEGYPVISGPNGYSVRAYDASPSLDIGGMEIEGGHPKTFILNNIVSIEVEEKRK